MKKFPLCIAIILMLSMVLTACGGSKGGASTAGKETDPSKMPELIWLMGGHDNMLSDAVKVEEELNKISMEKLGVKMHTLYYDDDTIKLALTSGEKWDIAFTCEWYNNYAVQAQAGYFADITEKVKTVTPTLYATMPEVVWDGTKVNGKVLAVPTKKDYAAEMFYRFDKELFVDTLGMEIPDRMTFFDIEPYLKAAKDAYNSGVPAASKAENPLKFKKNGFEGIDSNFDMINKDVMLGVPYSAVGTANENVVTLTIETPDLVDRFKAIHSWYKAGYINADAPTVEDFGKYSAVKSGQGFYGADAIWSGGDEYTQLISKFSGPFLSTASIRGSMNAINAKSSNIDLALKYLELVNTDQKYRDILRFGIEGVHWTRLDSGLVERTSAGTSAYGPWPFSQGSYSLSSVQSAVGVEVDPNMWNVVFEGYNEALATNTIGFSFDISSVEAKVAACTAVKNKYFNGLACGSLNPDEVLPTFISELEVAGIRDVQAECQRQLDAYIAQQ